MKNRIAISFAFCVALGVLSEPSLATEAIGIKANENPKKVSKNDVIFFANKVNGEQSKAALKYTKEKEKSENKAANTPRFQNGDITLVSHSPVASLSEHSLWVYKITGLTAGKSNRIVRLALEKTPPSLKLAIPSSCKTHGKVVAEKFDSSVLKQIPDGDSVCTEISVIDGVTYFEKKLAANVDTMTISFVATSVPASPLIGVQASIPGYQPIKKMIPGPNVE